MLMWTSVAASGFGDRVIMLAAEHLMGINAEGAVVSKITAGVAFAFFVPYLVLTIVGGWLADRLPRKWIMLACDESRAVVLLIAWFWAANYTKQIDAIPDEYHWKVFLIIAGTGAFAAIFNPSKFATMPQIVRTSDLQPANAILAGIALIASLIGFTMGGFVQEKLQMGIMVGVMCYAVSGTFFAFLKPLPHQAAVKPKERGMLVQTIKYLIAHRNVRNLVLLNILFWAASWVVVAAVTSLAKNSYGLSADEFFKKKNMLMVAFGGGALSSSMVMVWIRSRRVSGVIAMSSLFIAAICMFVLSLSRTYWLGFAMSAGAGFFGSIFLIGVDTLTQTITPDYIRGRVFGTRSMLNTCGTVVVNLCIWRLPEATADSVVVWGLSVTAGILGLVSMYGVWRTVTSGPLSTGMLNVMWHISRLYTLVWHNLEWSRRDRMPSSGRVIVAANHTTGIDGLLIQASLPRVVRWVMEPRCTPMNFLWRHLDPVVIEPGSAMAAMRKAARELKADDVVVGYFPEGHLQRDVRELGEFQPGIGLLARRSEAQIVPVWIVGTPRSKSMLWHFLLPSKSRVVFGDPYTCDTSKSNEQVTEELRRRMLELAESSRATP